MWAPGLCFHKGILATWDFHGCETKSLKRKIGEHNVIKGIQLTPSSSINTHTHTQTAWKAGRQAYKVYGKAKSQRRLISSFRKIGRKQRYIFASLLLNKYIFLKKFCLSVRANSHIPFKWCEDKNEKRTQKIKLSYTQNNKSGIRCH